MSSSLVSLKKRILGIKTINKITHAMELIAASKLQKIQKILKIYQPYCDETYRIISLIFSENNNNIREIKSSYIENKHFLSFFDDKPKHLYIVICSDMSFCGSFNHQIINLLRKEKDLDYVILLGKNGIPILKNYNIIPIASFVDFHEAINIDLANEIAITTLEKCQQNGIGYVKVVYTKYINSLSFKPSIVQLFPFSGKSDSLSQNNTNIKQSIKEQVTIYDPSISEILKNIASQYLATMLMGFLIESKISEQAIRRNTMENANKNADDLIETLTITANKLRQNKITSEIAEIIEGANASL